MPTPEQPALAPRPVQPGDEIEVPEAHYCFGSGTLHLRVTEVSDVMVWRDRDRWQKVRGPEIWWDGRVMPVRDAMVRIRGVRRLNDKK